MSNSLLDTILKLLKQTTSLDVLSNFLKSKKLPFSANSWEAMIHDRIMPAINNGSVTENDLINLLRTVEECGRQHIFLYKCNRQSVIDETLSEHRVREVLKESEEEFLMDSPRILDEPEEITLADVRVSQECLVVKLVGTRTNRTFVEETRSGGFVSRRYEEVLERTVNLIKVHKNGVMEIRIGSHENSNKYQRELEVMRHFASRFIAVGNFGVLSLKTLKNKLWESRQDLSDIIKFSNHTLANDYGNVLRASSSSEDSDLSSDDGIAESIEKFISHDGYCDSSNVWFKKGDVLPSRDIHVLFSGECNEFIIPVKCNTGDYEYVFEKIIQLNS